jgi:hypothetical protein
MIATIGIVDSGRAVATAARTLPAAPLPSSSVREPLDGACEADGADEDEGKASRKKQAGHR